MKPDKECRGESLPLILIVGKSKSQHSYYIGRLLCGTFTHGIDKGKTCFFAGARLNTPRLSGTWTIKMKRIAWTVDIHLNFLNSNTIRNFLDEIAGYKADALLIGGDIGEAPSITQYLRLIEAEVECPVYFVLGNHDFYSGSIYEVRWKVEELVSKSDRVHWLPLSGIVELTDKTCLVGHDSWADGRFGNYEQSTVVLNDYRLIRELSGLDRMAELLPILNKLGDEAAEYLGGLLPDVLSRYSEVIVLTHVPPFKESCRHQGEISDDNWLPHFSCKAVGDILVNYMREFPDHRMTVLCGHTHSAGEVSILPNLHVLTGSAEYGRPKLQGMLNVM